jgi:hypothetical protein
MRIATIGQVRATLGKDADGPVKAHKSMKTTRLLTPSGQASAILPPRRFIETLSLVQKVSPKLCP